MRKLPLGVAISTGVHAVALAFVGTRLLPHRPADEKRPKTEIEIVDVQAAKPQPPEAAPVEVALLDDAKLAAIAPPPGAIAVAPKVVPQRQAPEPKPSTEIAAEISTGRPPGTETAPGASTGSNDAEPGRTPSTGALSMRRGPRPNLTLPAGQWDALDHAPRGTDAEKDIHSGLLHDSAGGLHESDQGVFVGKVAADGTVAMKDARNLNVHFVLPSVHDIGNGLSAWYNSDKSGGGSEAPSAPLAKSLQATAGASTGLTDRTQPNATDRSPTLIVPIIGGGFDTTDWLMRRHGMDPYASKKLKFLDATRDERAQIGNRNRDQLLGHSARLMAQSLEALWKSRASLPERKEALFELWDDCAEAGSTSEVNGAGDARKLVIAFIQLHLPAGGPDAYTPAELAAFAGHKQSKADFRPYDP